MLDWLIRGGEVVDGSGVPRRPLDVGVRGERIAAYWAYCSSRWSEAPPDHYPGFEDWLRDADAFVAR